MKNIKQQHFSFVVPNATKEDLWPLVSDWRALTRWTLSILPKNVSFNETEKHLFVLAGRLGGMKFSLVAQEICSQWENLNYNHKRLKFFSGPFSYMDMECFLEDSDKGCRITFKTQVYVKGVKGRYLAKALFSKFTSQLFLETYLSAENRKNQFVVNDDENLPEDKLAHLTYAQSAMERGRFHHNLAGKLIRYILQAPAEKLRHIRPLEFADKWGLSRRETVELFLQGTKAQLLRMRWCLLCPHCESVTSVVEKLDHLPTGARCECCEKYFGRDFSKNVEVAFVPNDKVRKLDVLHLSLLTPQHAPLMLSRTVLQAKQKQMLKLALKEGVFLYRTLEHRDEQSVTMERDGLDEMKLDSEGRIYSDVKNADGDVEITNETDVPATCLVEDTNWNSDILSASKVTTTQAFRELFPTEQLSPGDEVAIGKVSILFTDLKASTEMYEDVGDAKAFFMVRDHFDFLIEEVRKNNGAVVKTIGDAVMAAFADAEDAARAGIAIQQRAKEFNARNSGQPVCLKVGVHTGSCIAVTLNNRLDYFGSMVNMAARLQGESLGDDVVLSLRTSIDANVSKTISRLDLEDGEAEIKGFEGKTPFVRILPQDFDEELDDDFADDAEMTA